MQYYKNSYLLIYINSQIPISSFDHITDINGYYMSISFLAGNICIITPLLHPKNKTFFVEKYEEKHLNFVTFFFARLTFTLFAYNSVISWGISTGLGLLEISRCPPSE